MPRDDDSDDDDDDPPAEKVEKIMVVVNPRQQQQQRRRSSELGELSILVSLGCCQAPMDSAWRDTACARAFARALARLTRRRQTTKKQGELDPGLKAWLREAVRAEAATLRHEEEEEGAEEKTVGFSSCAFAAMDPPLDSRRSSSLGVEVTAIRLAALVSQGEQLAAKAEVDPALSGTLSELAADLVIETTSKKKKKCRFEAEVSRAASFWASELAQLATGRRSCCSPSSSASMLRGRLDELLSSVLRFHVRRLLDPPPASPTRGGRVKADPDCRSQVHKLLRLESEDRRSLSVALNAALDHLAQAETTATSRDALLFAAADNNNNGEDAAEEVEDAARRVEMLRGQVLGACAHRFLLRLLQWPMLEASVEAAGGWGVVERFSRLCVAHASADHAARYAPLVDLRAFRDRLAREQTDVDANRKVAVATLQRTSRLWTAKKTQEASQVAQAAQNAVRDAMLYTELTPYKEQQQQQKHRALTNNKNSTDSDDDYVDYEYKKQNGRAASSSPQPPPSQSQTQTRRSLRR